MRKALLLLGILNDSDLDWLIATGSKRVLSPGTVLIRQGAPIDEVFLVLDGMLSVRTDKTGDADIARLRSGEVVGEMSFVDSRPPSASVFAIEPSAVLAIPRNTLQKRLDVDVAFCRTVLSRAGGLSFRSPAVHGRKARLRTSRARARR